MYGFYYQWPETGKTYLVVVRGGYPGRLSPIWKGCNTCVFLAPGTDDGATEYGAEGLFDYGGPQ
jgi:hypothetical protein